MQSNIEDEFTNVREEMNKSRSYLTRYLSSNTNYNHTGDNKYLQEPIKLDNVIDNSNGYLETGEDNSILIKAGVHHVNVKSSIQIGHDINEHAAVYVYIRKNGTIVSQLSEDADYKNTANSMTVFRDYLEVTEGDKIQTYFACDNETGSIKGNAGFPITQMSVQVVD